MNQFFRIDPERGLQGTIEVPADKSITHRGILFNAIAEGEAEVRARVVGRDNLATCRAVLQLGADLIVECDEARAAFAASENLPVSIRPGADGYAIRIGGRGRRGLRQPEETIDCGNSGTTARLLTGVVAAQPLVATLDGDDSLRKRPFARVVVPLSEMGARFSGDRLPLTIEGKRPLDAIHHSSPVASAQVKSAILLAGLSSTAPTIVDEPHQSRDHTERMLRAMGAAVNGAPMVDGRWRVSVEPLDGAVLSATSFAVPGDFSQAGFFLVAGAVLPHSDVLLEGVNTNTTRTGLLDVLRAMGAKLQVENERVVAGEPVADLRVTAGALASTTVSPETVVRAIDEIPILAVAAACAEGMTVIEGVSELRVKESDRLSMIQLLADYLGSRAEVDGDTLLVYGRGSGEEKRGAADRLPWADCGDHRIFMAGAIAQLVRTGQANLLGE
ncbi:MAG: 3-phosphoshikimate 1-carboxyvinyltransferase, partial [Bdellovibrionales bacterium]|nr:3-phosphoshikimate 1-carboxyvinyltransferase [Bdellovibrionales bacterium]